MTAAFSPVASLPLQAWHAAHGAQLVVEGGWRVPAVYSSIAAETAAARDGLALADLSALTKISLRGKEVSGVARSLFGAAPLRRVIPLTNKLGWACCLTESHCFLLAADLHDKRDPFNSLIQTLPGYSPELVFEATSAHVTFGLFGPNSAGMLSNLTSLDIGTALPPGSCAETGLAGVHALLIRPASAVPVVFLCVAWDLAEYVWQRLWLAGHRGTMLPIGMQAVRTLWNV